MMSRLLVIRDGLTNMTLTYTTPFGGPAGVMVWAAVSQALGQRHNPLKEKTLRGCHFWGQNRFTFSFTVVLL